MVYKCTIFVTITLVFCIGIHVCTISKVVGINKEKEVHGFCVDFSFSCIIKHLVDSLKQNIC